MSLPIDVKANGDRLEVKVTFRNGFAGDATWTLSNTCSDKFYAGLAADALSSQLRDAIREAREEAYNAGYADGRGKKKKSDWFRSSL